MNRMNAMAIERAKSGYSQKEMAKLMNIGLQTYIRLERNPAKTSVERMQRFQELTGCDIPETFFTQVSTETEQMQNKTEEK